MAKPDNRKLLGYNLDGMLLFELEEPGDYQFSYLSYVDSMPSVVCEGSQKNAEKYDRNTWHFILDTKSGDLIKSNLSF